jgi:hypothetical protein
MGWSIYERQPEEDLFRRVPGGWVFTIGGRWRYLVDDSQKAELLARLGRWRFVSFLFLATILGASVLISGALARPGVPDWVDLAIVTAIFGLAAVLLFAVAMPYFQLFILRPTLISAAPAASAPAASAPAPAGLWNSLFAGCRRQARIYSLRYLVFTCLFCGLFGITTGYAALNQKGDYSNYFLAITMIYLTVNFGVVLFIKLRGHQSPE